MSLPPHLDDYRTLVARAILSRHHNIRVEKCRKPILCGEFRVAYMEILAGDKNVTMCREYGFCYRLAVIPVLLYKQARPPSGDVYGYRWYREKRCRFLLQVWVRML